MADYEILCEQLESLAESDQWFLPVLANASALLYTQLPRLNWAGFYLRRNDELILGPFQGQPACVRIPFGKGVCGTAAALDQVQRVKDVHQFPGHIACDSASNSEIVIPLHDQTGRLAGVLDIDSPVRGRFGASHVPAAALAAGEIEKVLAVLGDLSLLAGAETERRKA